MADRVAATGNLSKTDWDSVGSLGPQIARVIDGLRAHIRSQLGTVDRSFTPGARAHAVDELLDDRLLTDPRPAPGRRGQPPPLAEDPPGRARRSANAGTPKVS